MEVSMETQKRKRGRPAMFTAEERALGNFLAGTGKFGSRTRRKQDNAIYQGYAIATIAQKPFVRQKPLVHPRS